MIPDSHAIFKTFLLVIHLPLCSSFVVIIPWKEDIDMENFREILVQNPPLLIFIVIGLGYILGSIKIKGFSIGIAGVLFVGLAFGTWNPHGTQPFLIPRQIPELGLILFVYAIGLSSGVGFFHAMRERGIKFNIATFASLVLAAILAILIGRILCLSPELIAGVFCGSLTNTPALAAVTQIVPNPSNLTQPAVGYSVTYPFAILTFLIAFQIFIRYRQREFAMEKEAAIKKLEKEKLLVKHFEVRNPNLFGHPIGELRVQDEVGVVISRIRHGEKISIPTKYTLLQEGDVILAVGIQKNIERAKEYFGAESSDRIDIDKDKIEWRRILVSNKKLAGRKIREFELERRFNAQITRLRRADIEFVPSHDDVIEVGDRLGVAMPTDKIGDVLTFFGDSERGIADLDFTAITLGISLGVLIGMIPIPLPGGTSLRLGIAGGPLIVALILGKLGRTGPLIWAIPLEANHTIRHIGLLLFLSGVGINSGAHFGSTIFHNGLRLLVLGVVISIVTTTSMIFLLRKFANSGVIGTLGGSSGMHTQPASLAYAYEISKSDDVYIAYAITYPVAMIFKIILAQMVFLIACSV